MATNATNPPMMEAIKIIGPLRKSTTRAATEFTEDTERSSPCSPCPPWLSFFNFDLNRAIAELDLVLARSGCETHRKRLRGDVTTEALKDWVRLVCNLDAIRDVQAHRLAQLLDVAHDVPREAFQFQILGNLEIERDHQTVVLGRCHTLTRLLFDENIPWIE